MLCLFLVQNQRRIPFQFKFNVIIPCFPQQSKENNSHEARQEEASWLFQVVEKFVEYLSGFGHCQNIFYGSKREAFFG